MALPAFAAYGRDGSGVGSGWGQEYVYVSRHRGPAG